MTPRKSAPLLCSALLIALFATGCKQDAAEEAEAASTDTAEATAETADTATVEPVADAKVPEPVVAPTPVPGTDAAIIEEKATPTAAAPTFDAKAFEGSYAAGDTALEVTADGMFALSKGGSTVEGTWTLQADGKTVTLDPDSKSDADRSLEVVSKDSVKLDGATLARKQ